MPIHDLGYRSWRGRRHSAWMRWWVVAETGIRLAWRSRWLRRMLLLAWLPAVYLALGFLAYEQWLTYETERLASRASVASSTGQRAGELAGSDDPQQLAEAAREAAATTARDVLEAEAREFAIRRAQHRLNEVLPGVPISGDRHAVWAWMMWVFFRYPQGTVMLLLVGMVAPPLIARDVGSRAFLLYFSRPLTRLEYLAGKLMVIWVYLLLITTAPALTLYLLGVLLSPDLSVVAATWDIPLRILAASGILAAPTTSLALAISSLTTKTWHAAFGWFAVWLFGAVAYAVLTTSVGQDLSNHWMLVSLYHTLGRVQSWVFGIGETLADVQWSFLLLASLTVLSLAVLFRRVSAPLRV